MPYKFGRLAARFPVRLSAFATYGQLPEASEVYDGPDDANFDYALLGNGPDPTDTVGPHPAEGYGDCGFAGFVHGFEADALIDDVDPDAPSTDQVVSAYLSFTHGVDSGVVLSEVLHTLYVTGILGRKVEGYAPLRSGLQEQLSAIEVFGWNYSGVMVPAPAQGQFAAGEPWALTHTSADNDIEGGHCVIPVSFDQATETLDVITWGRRQVVEWEWWLTYGDEAWAPLVRMARTQGHIGPTKWAQLQEDLRSIGGLVAA